MPIFSYFREPHLFVEMAGATVPGWGAQGPSLYLWKLDPHKLERLGSYPLILKVGVNKHPGQFIILVPHHTDDEPPDDLIVEQYLVILACRHHPDLPHNRTVARGTS